MAHDERHESEECYFKRQRVNFKLRVCTMRIAPTQACLPATSCHRKLTHRNDQQSMHRSGDIRKPGATTPGRRRESGTRCQKVEVLVLGCFFIDFPNLSANRYPTGDQERPNRAQPFVGGCHLQTWPRGPKRLPMAAHTARGVPEAPQRGSRGGRSVRHTRVADIDIESPLWGGVVSAQRVGRLALKLSY